MPDPNRYVVDGIDQRFHRGAAEADTIKVWHPIAYNGEWVMDCAEMRRELVIAKLDGTEYAEQARADPYLDALLLMDDEALGAWLAPDEYRELVRCAPER